MRGNQKGKKKMMIKGESAHHIFSIISGNTHTELSAIVESFISKDWMKKKEEEEEFKPPLR